MKQIFTPVLTVIFISILATDCLCQEYTHQFTKIAQINDGGRAMNVTLSPDRTIFLANGEDGLRTYDYESNSLINTAHIDSDDENGIASGVAVSSEGTIFLATLKDGLSAYNFNGSSLAKIAYVKEYVAHDLFLSQSGTIFLGWGSSGIQRVGLRAYTFVNDSFVELATIDHDGGSMIRFCESGIAELSDGTILLSADGLLAAYSYDGSSFTRIAEIYYEGRTWDLEVLQDGTLLLADGFQGLNAYSYDGISFTHTTSINEGGYATDLAVASDGTIFLANGEDGLRAYTFDGNSFTNSAHINDNGDAKGVTVSENGTIFLANGEAGLIAYEYSEFEKDLDSGLVAYFPFNGNANDISGNEHHGTVIGAELFPDRFGEFNSAYYFDGIDDVIALEDSLFSGEYLTISAWFKKMGNGADAWSSIVAGDCSTPYLGFNQNIPTFGGQCDSPMPHQWPDSAFIDTYWHIIDTNWHHIDTNWHHIAGVYDGANIILYLDNIALLNNYIGKFTYENSIPIGIGSSYQHFRDSESFFGVIDDVRIYDRPLNEAEISALYDPVTGLYDKKNTIVETKYQLLQNYPNPFNPVTIIKYSIPLNDKRQTSNVKLVVYDILGREIATLVDENQKPGNYEVDFDGSQLTSGIYFYRLKAGEFVETKKMIYLK